MGEDNPDCIKAVRKPPEVDEEKKMVEKEEEKCKHRWPMKFKERKVLAPAADSMGLASASDEMVGKRRNQVKRAKEAMVKER